ncbi:MAG: CoA transferase [Chloroflexi bacterium]|nr:CoA transferase [Chloroflexota bacterium]
MEGVRVVDLTISWAGPKVTQVLGDMGAEVIKVESIQYIDAQRGRKKAPRGMLNYPDREPGERPWNRFSAFNQLNRNKLGITLNLRRPEGKEIFKKLVAISDVAIDCFRAGLMDDLGLGYEVMRAAKPDIIMVSMSGFGKSGPYRNYLSWGSQIECLTGQARVRGYPDSQPFMVNAYGDPIAGLTGAFAIIVALCHRRKTGEGQFIDFAQVESLAPLSAEFLLDYVMNGRIAGPAANRHDFMAPHGVYRCRGDDQWVAIAVSNDREWQALVKAMGSPAWAGDETYSGAAARWTHRDVIDSFINAWTAGQDKYEVMHHLQAHGAPAGAVISEEEMFHDPHLKERGVLEMVSHPEAGTHPYPGPTWKFSGTPLRVFRPAPCLGQHNELVLGDYLGLSRDEIASLEAEQIIGKEPLEGADS